MQAVIMDLVFGVGGVDSHLLQRVSHLNAHSPQALHRPTALAGFVPAQHMHRVDPHPKRGQQGGRRGRLLPSAVALQVGGCCHALPERKQQMGLLGVTPSGDLVSCDQRPPVVHQGLVQIFTRVPIVQPRQHHIHIVQQEMVPVELVGVGLHKPPGHGSGAQVGIALHGLLHGGEGVSGLFLEGSDLSLPPSLEILPASSATPDLLLVLTLLLRPRHRHTEALHAVLAPHCSHKPPTFAGVKAAITSANPKTLLK
mmetsp:Transcript_111286/g.255258  ORF Transcript_111286/g.255258 Transcript_111286/m.255258 type:complete len:255 (-) Transcript_111286:173-937(-)